jgi:3-oxoadipate enol-lactonase
MPFVTVGDLDVRYELAGPAEAPMVVLSHSLGADLSMWDPQARALAARFRVLRYDGRGHGRTTVAPGPYSIETLARDVLALMDALGVERAHFCGLSMGGMIGMWLGAHARERIDRLVLCNTGARIGTSEGWNARIRAVERGGMVAVASAVVERWFTPEFRHRSPEVVARAERMVANSPAAGYTACCAAIRDADESPHLGAIVARTLVIAGTYDPATPPADGRALVAAIPRARYLELVASHLSNLEAEGSFTAELLVFLSDRQGD